MLLVGILEHSCRRGLPWVGWVCIGSVHYSAALALHAQSLLLTEEIILNADCAIKGTGMRSEDINIIKNTICPLIAKGEISLLLGAGFSYKNKTKTSELPSGDELIDILLGACGKTRGARTSLKDAYLVGKRSIPDFERFLEDCFTVEKVPLWQESIFSYVWNRIYTTNIDNVLSISYQQAKSKGKASADFAFFNYTDPSLASNTIGSIPVVSIHGDIRRASEGFIFSNLEYAQASAKILDWHNELASKIIVGGLVVVGNQLDESDIETHLATRIKNYGDAVSGANWIVMPEPDDIKSENYVAAGFYVIDATAEEFFDVIFRSLPPKTIDDLLLETIPSTRKRFSHKKAMVWFKEAFSTALLELDKAKDQAGILRHYISGAHPDWFYICNSAYAITSSVIDLTQNIAARLTSSATGVGILHVVGPSGSGKTTAIRGSLIDVIKTYPYVYEYDSENGIDVELLLSIIESFTEKSVIVFYSAAEFYYAVNAVATRLKGRGKPFCLFVLEDRANDYQVNKRQISGCRDISAEFGLGHLKLEDAKSIVKKIEEHGVKFDGFSDLPIEKRARILLDKERGYGGDLLSALYSLTTHENFEKKIYQEYHLVKAGVPRQILDVVTIFNYLGFSPPINYVAGSLSVRVEDVVGNINEGLSGIVIPHAARNRVNCRHRVIADYYFKNCLSGQGAVDFIVGVLDFLSRQFTVEDIRLHPLAYQIYKRIISFDFLYERYFPQATRRVDAERTYHEAQKMFGRDGVFWLHYGRFYRKVGELDNAIDCFRTGLTYYDSYQTRHSLGTALLDKYIEEGCADSDLYTEGVEHLENERSTRGSSDAYPTSTLSHLLIKICRLAPNNGDAKQRLKGCINFGLKHFKGDVFFERVAKDYLNLSVK